MKELYEQRIQVRTYLLFNPFYKLKSLVLWAISLLGKEQQCQELVAMSVGIKKLFNALYYLLMMTCERITKLGNLTDYG